jgi:hypothetical protein
MTNKYHSDTQEEINTIIYIPSLQDSGNLVTDTDVIAAASKQETANYSADLITSNSPDSRLKVRRLCQRLNVHIDSFQGEPAATKLFYSIEVNGIERASGEFTAAGADNPIAWDLTDGQFNLGTANTIEVFLWVDRGTAQISVVQLWQGVGTCTTGWASFPLEVIHKGLAQVSANFSRVGIGNPGLHLLPLGSSTSISESLQNDISSKLSITKDIFSLRLKGTIATDLNFIQVLNFSLYNLQ